MKLEDIIDGIYVKSVAGPIAVEVSGVFYDSRQVVPGGVFCALEGLGSDGHDYLDQAIENGAVAIISERSNPAEFPATWLQVGNARDAMGTAAAQFEGNPSLRFPVVGVTGTNGKTTTTFLIHHLFETILRRAGLIGTIHYSTGGELEVSPHTTPESPDLQRLLGEMVANDCRGVAMEVSSHGLSQGRVKGVAFDVGVFTNLTQDHLDYHGTMDNYYAAKRRLFEQMDTESAKEGVAIINTDDTFGERLTKEPLTRIKKYSFGRGAGADFQASDIRSDFDGTRFKLSFRERSFLVRIPLIGSFNVYNALAAIASGYAVGLNLREMVATMASSPQVPGRLEAIGNRQINYRVFVDYAHTPDALVSVLDTLQGLQPNRIITVFGCGGDRDVLKRPLMARAAEQGGDYCILTSDNPRTEDPEVIVEGARNGFRDQNHEVVLDRAEAITRAIDMAGERDIVLIAGKGHETYQEINGVRYEFDDRSVAASRINRKAERGGQ